MIGRHLTQFVFWVAVLVSVLSIGLLMAWDNTGGALAILGGSALLNVGSVLQSERGGFAKTRQMRRAHEPARNFNSIQVLVVILLVMVQAGVTTYVLVV